MRTVVEIEALAKELYFKCGGLEISERNLYFDTDCLDMLEKKWILSKKKVIVASANFYFDNEKNKVLKPLKKANKRGTSSADWKKAYQAIKQNRTKNLKKGNIKNLIRALSALFLLNLYYREDIFDLAGKNNPDFANNFSDIFNIKVHTWKGNKNEKDSYVKSEDYEECSFLIKWTDKYKAEWNEYVKEQDKILRDMIFNHPKVKKHISDNLIENGMLNQEKFNLFIKERKYFDLLDMKNEYGVMVNQAFQKSTEKLNFNLQSPQKFEAILNKHQKVDI